LLEGAMNGYEMGEPDFFRRRILLKCDNLKDEILAKKPRQKEICERKSKKITLKGNLKDNPKRKSKRQS
jgi:hypothetical protein